MIDPGTPVSRGTDWLSLDVPQIWSMLADHETEAHQRVVSGWRKTAELSQLHLQRLQAYRRELAATWSPTGSAAAREYLDRLDFLIATIRQTHDTASTNYTTFAAATSAVTQSRRDLQQVYDDYTAKAQIRLDYDRLMQERKAMGGGEIFNSTPPVSDQELQQLRGRARLIMYGLSSELRQAQVELQMPPMYETDRRRKDRQDDHNSGPSVVSPVASALASNAATAALQNLTGSTTPSPITSTPGAGPVLGSAGPPAPAQPLVPGIPPVASPPPPGPGGGGPVPPVLTPGGVAGSRPSPLRPGGNTAAMGQAPQRPGPRAALPGPGRTIASGGVIGGTPVAGAPGAPARGSRINPVGGVIGAGTGAVSATRGPAGQTIPGSPMTVGRANARRSDEEPRRWDPDQPWDTEQGVDPVLLPPVPQNRNDPGPAIGHVR